MISPLTTYRELRKSLRKHGLQGTFANGTHRTRSLYTRLRELRAPGAMRLRRSAARALAEAGRGIAIEPDVGFEVLPPGALPGVDDVVSAARGIVAMTPDDRLQGAHNVGLLDTDALDPASPFVRLALSEEVLRAVTAYLGVTPVLRTVDVWDSRHTGQAADGSRLWHLDGDDVRQVKLFVHCTDVRPESGPLTVLDAETSRRIRDAVSYRLGKPRIPDEQVTEIAPDAELHPFTGPAGTAALVDTSACLHFGSRVEEGADPRVLVMIQYVTPFGFSLAGDYRESAPYRHLANGSSSELERLILGAD